eukprot:Ihof_evm18s46 gene=Ihof_evmTU18s46
MVCSCQETVTSSLKAANHRRTGTQLRRLLRAQDVEPYAMLPHILDGYPNLKSTLDCFRSWFWIHNETVNIWTHMIGFFMMIYLLFLTADEMGRKDYPIEDRVAFMIFFICASLCFGFSIFYHTFKCYKYSIYRLAVTMDYVGIFIMICGSFISGLHFEFYCDPLWRTIYQVGITVVCVVGMSMAFLASFDNPASDMFRVKLYSFIVGFSAVPFLHITFLLDASRTIKWGVLILIYGCGALAYLSKFPESLFPGKFDIW